MSELVVLVAIIMALASPSACDVSILDEVEIVTVGDVRQEDVKRVEDVLSSVPQSHLVLPDCGVALNSITLVEGDNLKDLPPSAPVYERNPDYDGTGACGLAELSTGDIFIASDCELDGTLSHEIGHVIFDGLGEAILSNALTSWKLTHWYLAGDVSMGKYSRKNALEFRAEAYEHCAVGKPMSFELMEIMGALFGGAGCSGL